MDPTLNQNWGSNLPQTQSGLLSNQPLNQLQNPIATSNEAHLDQNLIDLTGMQQKEVDRIIVHDHGQPIKRGHGAVYKDNRNDPGLSGDIHRDVPGMTGGMVNQGLGATSTDQSLETGEHVKKEGFFGKMKHKLADWKESRRQKKLARERGEDVGPDSPEPMSPEREHTHGTTGTGLGTGLGSGTGTSTATDVKDKAKSGSWDFPDQRMKRADIDLTQLQQPIQQTQILSQPVESVTIIREEIIQPVGFSSSLNQPFSSGFASDMAFNQQQTVIGGVSGGISQPIGGLSSEFNQVLGGAISNQQQITSQFGQPSSFNQQLPSSFNQQFPSSFSQSISAQPLSSGIIDQQFTSGLNQQFQSQPLTSGFGSGPVLEDMTRPAKNLLEGVSGSYGLAQNPYTPINDKSKQTMLHKVEQAADSRYGTGLSSQSHANPFTSDYASTGLTSGLGSNLQQQPLSGINQGSNIDRVEPGMIGDQTTGLTSANIGSSGLTSNLLQGGRGAISSNQQGFGGVLPQGSSQ